MKRAGIIYFSGTGNTRIVALSIKDYLNKRNIETDLINIECDKPFRSDYDYVIIGAPVYVERYPEIMLKYLEKNLGDYNGKCMMFTTQGVDNLTAAFSHAKRRLKNLNITYCDYIVMPNNFYTFMFKKYSKEQEKQAFDAVPNKVKVMIDQFLNDVIKVSNKSMFSVIIAELGYRLTYPFLRNYFINKIKINKDICIKCRLCEKNCPTKSIKIEPKLKINNECIFCQRCINNCPVNAFTYKGKTIEQYKR